jgi:UDP-4-amino-4,6-dideoxy-N-acetyl-beta-L-altrosamine transaminase
MPYQPVDLMAEKMIPYGKQWLDDDDIDAVVEVLKGDWITQGPKIAEFESALTAYTGAKYAVTFSSGTAALHAAMFAAGIKGGDEVITSPITFVATPNSVLYQRGQPVFVDIDPHTYCLDIDLLEGAITPNTKAIAPVDMAGYPVDMRRIREIADAHDLMVIEDAAHALGARRYGKTVGEEADMTMFSFHPVKHITTGEGGAIVTDDEEYYRKLTIFRNHGITKDEKYLTKHDGPWYYEMHQLGYNYRLTDIQCALGISQLRKNDSFIRRRNEIAAEYDHAFADNPLIFTPPRPPWTDSLHAYHIYPILLQNVDRGEVYYKLRERGILSQIHYIPVHLQPYYRDFVGYREKMFPCSEEYYEQELTIPLFPRMTDEEVGYVIESITEILGED